MDINIVNMCLTSSIDYGSPSVRVLIGAGFVSKVYVLNVVWSIRAMCVKKMSVETALRFYSVTTDPAKRMAIARCVVKMRMVLIGV